MRNVIPALVEMQGAGDSNAAQRKAAVFLRFKRHATTKLVLQRVAAYPTSCMVNQARIGGPESGAAGSGSLPASQRGAWVAKVARRALWTGC